MSPISAGEIACLRWAIAVAEHGISRVKVASKPGVSELQLWVLLNYTNIANNGDWHDRRMLASGPREWIRASNHDPYQELASLGTVTFMGIGSSERPKAVRWAKAREIVSTWVTTIPGTGASAIATYFLVWLTVGIG